MWREASVRRHENLKPWAPKSGHLVEQLFLKHQPSEEFSGFPTFQHSPCSSDKTPLPTKLLIRKVASEHSDNQDVLSKGLARSLS